MLPDLFSPQSSKESHLINCFQFFKGFNFFVCPPWFSHPNNYTFFYMEQNNNFHFWTQECQFLPINCVFPKFSRICASCGSGRSSYLLTNVPVWSLFPLTAQISFPVWIPANDFISHSSVTRKTAFMLSAGPCLLQSIEQKRTEVFSTSFREQNWKKFTVASIYVVLDNLWYLLHAHVGMCQTVRKTLSWIFFIVIFM